MATVPVRISVAGALALIAIAVLASPIGARASAAASQPRVTFVGDSVAEVIRISNAAMDVLSRGIDLRLEVAVCRRLTGASCLARGVRPPTVLDLVTARSGELGTAVVVAVGYNDPEAEYPASIEEVIGALREAGVERILWVTLRAVRNPYLTMNAAIRDAAERHPEVTVVDLDELARTHPGWFAEDGLHPNEDGALALAALVRRALGDVGVAPPLPALTQVERSLPQARVGMPFRARLTARGGESEYRWKRVDGRLPKGGLAPARRRALRNPGGERALPGHGPGHRLRGLDGGAAADAVGGPVTLVAGRGRLAAARRVG
ncbi:MAG: hypothetical protein FJW96_03860 [Actinobacteria bacterium]|nr:hypothetical protein [Actinomycetota bacterium]